MDDIHVVGGPWVRDDLADIATTTVWNNENVLGRATGQLVGSPAVAHKIKADALVSLSPIVSPFRWARPRVCFQHDWRHKKNPHEFPVIQRAYRRLWEISANYATLNVCISAKAVRETQTYAPRATTILVENGRDHARHWAQGRTAPTQNIVTFGHHNNKRPDLVIDAFALAQAALAPSATLTVLGARGDYARELRARAEKSEIADRMIFPGFVSETVYQHTIANASAIVMASSDEGFGLPVAEAQHFGIPAVITADSGMEEIFGNYPLVAAPSAESIAEALMNAHTNLDSPRGRGATWTWGDTARATREAIVGASKTPPRTL
ncbi:glycosyltransferase [Microbacterium aurantiacum]|uniref:glycosyltransferase n=1 Tax=Microbacterium aurantiacum TaxID=162393 RepID=UPI003445928E